MNGEFTADQLTAPAQPEPALTTRQLAVWATLFGFACFLLHAVFAFHYGLYFGSDMAIVYLVPKRMLLGEFPLYLWGQDYMGWGPVEIATAGVFRAFGASIPLGGLVALAVWSIGIALLVAYAGRCFGRTVMLACGGALAVGAPLFNKFSTQNYGSQYDLTPLYLAGFFWLATLALRRGPQSLLCVLIGLLMGWFWYACKLVLPAWLAVGAAFLLFQQGRAFLREFIRSRMLLYAGAAFLIGYSPELLFRLGLAGDKSLNPSASGDFFSVAFPGVMARNFYMLMRCIPAYFDADPFSRSSNGVHYFQHQENWESFPSSAADIVGLIAAFMVISFLLRSAWESGRQKDMKVFLLASCPLVNALIIVVSGHAGGSYYSVRRYILAAGVLLVMWLGVQLGRSFQARRWGVFSILALTLVLSAFHQFRMLQLPDELADYRKTVADIEQRGYKYGMSWYTFSHTLTALSNEKTVFGILDRKVESPYQRQVLAQDEVAFVWPAREQPLYEDAQRMLFGRVMVKPGPAPRFLADHVTAFGVEYWRIGNPRMNGELSWAPYRKQPPSDSPLKPPAGQN